MKALFICGDVQRIGGIEKYNRDFVAALKLAGVELKVIERFEGKLSKKIKFTLRLLVAYFVFKPRHIFCGHLNFSPICYFINKMFNTPYTIALYGIEIISLAKNNHLKALACCEKIITISEYSRNLIKEKIPQFQHKIFMHPSAVDGNLFSIKDKNEQLVQKYNLKDKKVILSLARLSTNEHKGQDRVLQAIPKVLQAFPNAVYLIVGSGKDSRVTDFLVKHPEIQKNVILVGSANEDEKTDFYNLADIYILPSKLEGFGIVFIEALSCGLPVIASDGYGCRESLFDGQLGTVVDPDNIDAISKVIIRELSFTKTKVDKEKLREKTLQHYGIDAWNTRVLQLVQDLKKNRPSLAIFMSHPIQYQVPLLCKIAESQQLKMKTYFYWDFGVKETYDVEFKRKIKWDIPILQGYNFEFLNNISLKPGATFFGEINPSALTKSLFGKYDAVMIFGWALFSNWLVLIGAKLSGKTVLLQAETPYCQEIKRSGLKQSIRKFVLKFYFSLADRILYIGEENRKFYKIYGVPDQKLFYAPYSINNDRYFKEDEKLSLEADIKSKLKLKYGLKNNGPIILFVGKIFDKKKPWDLLKAYEQIIKNITNTFDQPNLVFVGDGEQKNDLEKYCKDQNLDHVHFMGFRNQLELPEFYKMSDIFVLPSGFGETWGLVVNEAMCFGLSIVVSDVVGCSTDLVKNDINGYVFEYNNVQKLSEALQKLINHPERLKQFGLESKKIIYNYNYDKDVAAITESLC